MVLGAIYKKRLSVVRGESEYYGIEAGAKNVGESQSDRGSYFRNCLVAALLGTLAANGLYLTFFGNPIAIGWHFALLWTCLAWSVLGIGPCCIEVGQQCWWSVGTLPIIPILWLELWEPELPHPLAFMLALTFSSYAAFWCDRVFGGSL